MDVTPAMVYALEVLRASANLLPPQQLSALQVLEAGGVFDEVDAHRAMCPDGRHCLIRVYEAGLWYLRCTNCPYLIQE